MELTGIYKEIWEKSRPYQDSRQDEGHTLTVVDFFYQILESESGNEAVIVPAALLHDVGWSRLHWMPDSIAYCVLIQIFI